MGPRQFTGEVFDTKKMLAGTGIAAVSMGGMAIMGVPLHSETDVTAGHGEVTNIQAINEYCTVGYDVKMSGVKAHYGLRVQGDIGGHHISIPTYYSETVTYDGTVSNKLCHDATKIRLAQPGDKLYESHKRDCQAKKLCAFMGGKYTITTFEKHPGQGYQTPSNGLPMALEKNAVNALNVFPLHIKGDTLSDQLRGVTFLSAQETSATKCLKVSARAIRAVQQASVREMITQQVNNAAAYYKKSSTLNPDGSDVAVVDQSDIKSATTQYAKELKRVKAKVQHLDMTAGGSGSCEMSPALKAKYQHLDAQGNQEPSS